MNYFVVLMTILVLLANVGCGQKSRSQAETMANVRIMVGVVMKSGDVKNVARRNFLASKVDIVSLWEMSKKKSKWDRNLIEQETKDELGYEEKLQAFQGAIGEKQAHIKQLWANHQDQLRSIVRKCSKHMEETYEKGMNYGVGYYFDVFRIPSEPYEEFMRDADKRYSEVMKYPITQYAKKFLAERYSEFKEIRNQFENAAIQIRTQQNEIEKIGQERATFIKNYAQTVSDKEKIYFDKAKAYFITEYQENYITTFKTDLSGGAEVKLPKGKCFLFGGAEIGLNYIVWNYEANIAEEGQYIELSNDNASSLSKEDTTQIVGILSGLETK
jgi:hypothetical protein